MQIVRQKRPLTPAVLGLWAAQGFGIGRAPVAPGTLGSIIGFGWFLLLIWPGHVFSYAGGGLVGIALSIWLCGIGERQLQSKDPGSVILDEICAVPLCFAGWVWVYARNHAGLPGPGYFFKPKTWMLTLTTLALFRLFDIWKPWPIRKSQNFAGGWGVTVDDLLAAFYAAALAGALALVLPAP